MKTILSAILGILLMASPVLAGPPVYGGPGAPASETTTGTVELATDAETVTGSATDKVTTPANITARLAAPGAIGGTTPAAGTFTTLTGRTRTKTISTTPVTLTEAELKNSIVYVTTGASVILLPTATATMDGAACVIEAIAAVAPSIDLTTGTDIISLGGTDLTAGNKLTFDGAAGTSILIKYDATASRWRVRVLSGVAIDGGA